MSTLCHTLQNFTPYKANSLYSTMNKTALAVAAEQTYLPNAAPMSLNDFAAVQDNIYLYTQGNVVDTCAQSGPMFQYGTGSAGCSPYASPYQFSARHYSANLESEEGNIHKQGGQYPMNLRAHLGGSETMTAGRPETMTRASARGHLAALGYAPNTVDVANSCIGQPNLGQPQPAYAFQIQNAYSPQMAQGWAGCGSGNPVSPFGGFAPPLNS